MKKYTFKSPPCKLKDCWLCSVCRLLYFKGQLTFLVQYLKSNTCGRTLPIYLTQCSEDTATAGDFSSFNFVDWSASLLILTCM